jgi:O-antigen/teichoic acid export membrane protein
VSEPGAIRPPLASHAPHRPALSMHGRIARDTALNLAGLATPLLVGFLVLPVTARHLGPARFGLLGLAWALLEYFSLFDVGLGRATTKRVAEGLARREPGIGQTVIVSALSQTMLGVVGGVALALLAPLLAGRVLAVGAPLLGEATAVFHVLGLTLPIVLLAMSLRGVLEAAQRFDLSNLIRIPSSIATFVIPAIGATLGLSLPAILLWMLAARAITCIVLAWLIPRAVPAVHWRRPSDWAVLRPLAAFGGWVAVSNVISPVLIYLDRFVLGSLIGLAAVGYYTGPYELTVRLLIVPASLITTLFPAVSALSALAERGRVGRMFAASVRNTLLAMLPPVAVLLAFAPDILRLWLGPDFSAQSSLALRLLAIGVLVNAVAHVPFGYLQALGRPDLTAKFHVAELAVHLPVTWLLVRAFGISGAALAWTLRATLDATLLFAASGRALRSRPREVLANRGWAMVRAVALLFSASLLAAMVPGAAAARIAVMAIALSAFALLVWTQVMDADERAVIAGMLGRATPATRAADVAPGGVP